MTLKDFFAANNVSKDNVQLCECSVATYQHNSDDADSKAALGMKVQYLFISKAVSFTTAEGITVNSEILTISQRLAGKIKIHGDEEGFSLFEMAEVSSYESEDGTTRLSAICKALRTVSKLTCRF